MNEEKGTPEYIQVGVYNCIGMEYAQDSSWDLSQHYLIDSDGRMTTIPLEVVLNENC